MLTAPRGGSIAFVSAMTVQPLVPYEGAMAPPGIAVSASVTLVAPAVLRLDYRLIGDLARVLVPPAAAGARTDRLWERTCFEAFVGEGAGEHYVELNFSPSTEWAAYSFDGYRRGMRALDLEHPPAIAVERGPRSLVVTASVDLAAPGDAGWRPRRVGLTAIVAGVSGQVSHWALAHPREKPDFHDAAGWTLTLEGMAR
jgi:hypothetical protein